jgi:hypothetical protein
MKTLDQSLLLAIGALALAETAFAQVPSTNDTSTSGGPMPVAVRNGNQLHRTRRTGRSSDVTEPDGRDRSFVPEADLTVREFASRFYCPSMSSFSWLNFNTLLMI